MRVKTMCLSVISLFFAALSASAGSLEQLKTGVAPASAQAEIAQPAAPVNAGKYLPDEGVKVLEKRGYDWYPDAHSILVKVLPGMRSFNGLTVVSCPDDGVFDYMAGNTNAVTYYGFRIFYKGPTVDISQYEGTNKVADFEGTRKVLEKIGAKLLWVTEPAGDTDFKITYLRDITKPDLETEYSEQLANAAKVKAWVDATVARLTKEGKLVAYTTAYATSGSVVYAAAK